MIFPVRDAAANDVVARDRARERDRVRERVAMGCVRLVARTERWRWRWRSTGEDEEGGISM